MQDIFKDFKIGKRVNIVTVNGMRVSGILRDIDKSKLILYVDEHDVSGHRMSLVNFRNCCTCTQIDQEVL